MNGMEVYTTTLLSYIKKEKKKQESRQVCGFLSFTCTCKQDNELCPGWQQTTTNHIFLIIEMEVQRNVA